MEELTAALRLNLRRLKEEERRLREHRTTTAAGAEVVRATLQRLEEGISGLEGALEEAEAQQAGVLSLRYRMALSDLRAGTVEAVRTVCRVASDGALWLPDGDVVALVGDRAQRWAPEDALKPRWSVPGAGAPRRIGDQVLLGRGTVIDPQSGAIRLRTDREVVATGTGRVVLAEGAQIEVRDMQAQGEQGAAPFRIALDHELLSAWVEGGGEGGGQGGGEGSGQGGGQAILLRTAEGLERWEAVTEPERALRLALRSQRRLGSNAVITREGGRILAFPMVLDGQSLEPVAALLRPAGASLGPRWLLAGDVVLAVGEEVWAWRISAPSEPMRLDVHGAVASVERWGGAVILHPVHREGGGAEPVGLDLGRWPPRRLDAADQALRWVEAAPHPPPRRHRFRLDGSALIREDRLAVDGAGFCEEVAAWALSGWLQAAARAAARGQEPEPGLTGSLAAISRDALVVSAERHAKEAAAIARRLCEIRPGQGDQHLQGQEQERRADQILEEMERLLDRICRPMHLLQRAPPALQPDSASADRVRGLFADCVDAVLRELAGFIGLCADPERLLQVDIGAILSFLPRLRTLVLERAPGLPWTGLDRVMKRFKQLIGDSRQLQDVAAAARALPSLAAASSALRRADLGVDPAVLERLGQSMQDIAAASRADAEVDALWSPSSESDLRSRVESGVDQLRRDLKRLDATSKAR